MTDRARDERRYSWAATENIIPTTSGAAKALGYIWPELEIDGTAYRVRVRTGSIAEHFLVVEREVSAEDVKDALRTAAAEPPLLGVIGVFEDEWASSRVVGERLSSLVDPPLLRVGAGGTFAIATWYDNEMGYSCRLAEAARVLATSGGR